MKKIFIFSGIILVIFLITFFNCPQPSSSKGGSSNDSPPPLKVSKIITKFEHTIALLNNGTVKCWGGNFHGELGYGDIEDRGDEPGEMGSNLSTVDLGTGRTAVQIAAGIYHTVVLLDNGTVKCWGRNVEGQLGYEDMLRRGDSPGEMGDALPTVDLGTGRTAVQIAAGEHHTVVILEDGTVKCWGDNSSGQLGYGDTNSKGDEPGEMGDALPTVDLGTGRTAIQIAAGSNYTIVLLDDGTVKCWGNSNDGQLGYGDTNNRGDGPGEMGDALPTVDLGTGRTAVQIAAGYYHTAVLLDNSKIKCWGWNGAGQLGYGDIEDRGDEPGEMGNSLDSVNLDPIRLPIKVITGYNQTIAIFDDNTIKCWGGGNFGKLGYEDTETRGNEPGEMGTNLLTVDVGTGRTVLEIAGGNYYTAAVLDNGLVKCWGRNNQGQLGYGDTDTRGDEPNEMGDDLPFVSLW